LKEMLIIGAGLAGLTCAKVLADRGIDFLLLEAGNGPGGRVRTETDADGFVYDHGFQVILDSYPTLRRHVDIPGLDPCYFTSGALMVEDGEFYRIENPLRSPQLALATALTPVFSMPDRIKFATLIAGVLLQSDEELLGRAARKTDSTTLQFLLRVGFSDAFLYRFAQPFFGGVFLDNDLQMSSGLFRYYLKKFALGSAFIPTTGMQALPRQLAVRCPEGSVRYGVRASRVEPFGAGFRVTTEAGEVFESGQVVLATDEPATRRLLGLPPVERVRSTVVVYFESAGPLYTGATLVLPAGDERRVRHFAQLTNVGPFAPRPFLTATVLDPGTLSDEQLAAEAAREIREAFPAAELTFKRVIRVPYALRFQPPGFAATRLESPFPGVILAGDQVSSSSIEAAMQSGEKAAGVALGIDLRRQR